MKNGYCYLTYLRILLLLLGMSISSLKVIAQCYNAPNQTNICWLSDNNSAGINTDFQTVSVATAYAKSFELSNSGSDCNPPYNATRDVCNHTLYIEGWQEKDANGNWVAKQTGQPSWISGINAPAFSIKKNATGYASMSFTINKVGVFKFFYKIKHSNGTAYANLATGLGGTVTVVGKADLIVSNATVTPSSFDCAGGNLTLTYKIKNIGNANATGSRARVYVSTSNTNHGTSSSASQWIGSLAINEEKSFTLNDNVPPRVSSFSQVYYFHVDADADANIDESNEGNNKQVISFSVNCVPPACTPAPIPSLSSLKVGNTQNTINWSSVGADKYNIYRNNVYLTSTTDVSYTDIGLSNGTNYCYQITSVKNDCESEKSIEFCGEPTAPCQVTGYIRKSGVAQVGIRVDLKNADETSILQTIETDANGQYAFTVDCNDSYCVVPVANNITPEKRCGKGGISNDFEIIPKPIIRVASFTPSYSELFVGESMIPNFQVKNEGDANLVNGQFNLMKEGKVIETVTGINVNVSKYAVIQFKALVMSDIGVLYPTVFNYLIAYILVYF
jgi:CARDB